MQSVEHLCSILHDFNWQCARTVPLHQQSFLFILAMNIFYMYGLERSAATHHAQSLFLKTDTKTRHCTPRAGYQIIIQAPQRAHGAGQYVDKLVITTDCILQPILTDNQNVLHGRRTLHPTWRHANYHSHEHSSTTGYQLLTYLLYARCYTALTHFTDVC